MGMCVSILALETPPNLRKGKKLTIGVEGHFFETICLFFPGSTKEGRQPRFSGFLGNSFWEGQTMLERMMKQGKGFTLIEVIIVIAIIGILATIAAPQFIAHRQRASNAGAQEALRNAAHAQDLYFIQNQTYAEDLEALKGEAFGFQPDSKVAIEIIRGDHEGYTIAASHSRGTKTYILSGPGGEILEK